MTSRNDPAMLPDAVCTVICEHADHRIYIVRCEYAALDQICRLHDWLYVTNADHCIVRVRGNHNLLVKGGAR